MGKQNMELHSMTLEQLKTYTQEKGIEVKGDKRKKQTYIDAINEQKESRARTEAAGACSDVADTAIYDSYEAAREQLESAYNIPTKEEVAQMTKTINQRPSKQPKFNGLILYKGVSAIDNVTPIIVIATGFKNATKNPKTGDAIQTWILVDGMHPMDAINSGSDSAICGSCPHRKQADGTRSCYVNPMSFSAVYKAYLKGNYPMFEPELHLQYFVGRTIRFGSYGEPINIPYNLVNLLVSVSSNSLGYTHRWKDVRFNHYQEFFQASVDSISEFLEAKDAGWGTFRVAPQGANDKLKGEVTCMGGIKTNCALCSLCSGTQNRQVHVTIEAHGAGAKYVG